ncbi:MAG: mannosyltransferase family protein [Acidimicrobiales bacterium]
MNRSALRVVLMPWLLARVLVIGALAMARYLASHLHPPPDVVTRVHEGLLGWDAGYYRDIAERGYAALGHSALRFFPLLPLATRGLHDVSRLSINDCLLLITNGSALAAGVLLHRLALSETGDRDLARNAVWILYLAPSAFVLVMGYSEGPMILLAVAAFLCLRSGRWWAAAGCGYLAGLTRPVGVLLALPALIEAMGLTGFGAGRRQRAGASASSGSSSGYDGSGSGPRGLLGHPLALLGRLAAVLAPGAGCATYLGWTAYRFGSFLAPVNVQEQGNLRGHFADPLSTALSDLRGMAHGHLGTGLHIPWLIVFLGLAVVVLARWPLSYGALAVATLGLAISSSNFDSLERYALSAFPLSLAAAGLLREESRFRLILPLLGGILVCYSLLAFMNAYVP